MNNEAMTIEARTVAELEQELACIERVLLRSWLDTDMDYPSQDSHHEGAVQ